MRNLTSFLAAFALTASMAFTATPQTQADPEAATGLAAKPELRADRFMIVAAHPLAAEAGRDILGQGGSAVDAMIAAQLMLNVVEPQSSGIGGGAFALHWDAAEAALTTWDGRETAPASARPDMHLDADGERKPFLEAAASGFSVGVPGLVRMMADMHARHGKLPWARLFEPAIDASANGFTVSPRMSASLGLFGNRLQGEAADVFTGPLGAPLLPGMTFKQPGLAETLRTLADEGADAFYEGPIAEAIIAAVAEGEDGATLTMADLGGYQAVERPALCMTYRARYEICGMGPPSSGATTVGQMLGLLDHFPLHTMSPQDPRAWHLFAEASRLAYADRGAYLGDADFVSVPAKGLLDPAYLTTRAQLIAPDVAGAVPATAGNPPWREGRIDYAPSLHEGRPGTTHLSVVDADGNAVALTSSIEIAFGSGRMAAGFLLNNQLTDFSFRPEIDGKPVANAVAPGKRPRSSMAPTMVFRSDRSGGPVLVLGSPGGSRIIEYVAAATIAILDWDMSPAEAAAMIHVSQRNGAQTAVEVGAEGDEIAAGLTAMGHEVARAAMTSGLHIIQRRETTLIGGADPRREGIASGE
ncbi:MAG: gamma-glutamyltransferase [Pseudomonadota bacterium]